MSLIFAVLMLVDTSTGEHRQREIPFHTEQECTHFIQGSGMQKGQAFGDDHHVWYVEDFYCKGVE